MSTATPTLDCATALAGGVRKYLLGFATAPRDLAGQCGLAAMLGAAALADPRALRTGFFMKFESLFGKRGRYPHRHAWCRIDATIVDVTASQFGRNHRAVHLSRADEDDHYIETSRGAAALNGLMTHWRGCESPAYVQIAEKLRRSLRTRNKQGS